MDNRACIAKVALPLPIDRLFDYSIPPRLKEAIKIGMRVKVLFNNKITFGFVVGFSAYSKIKKLNSIIALLDNYPLLTNLNLKLARMIKDYYICSFGEAIACMLPYHFKNTQNITLSHLPLIKYKNERNNKLTYVQKLCEDKTFAYFKEEINRRIQNKKRVIFLVPEIKMIEKVKAGLLKDNNINIAVWHGKLTKKEVLNLWNDLNQDRIDVVIGTRSAVFIPINNLSLIIIENEGDYAYKEDQVPYYDALDVAMLRAQIQGCDAIFSSAVPSSWTYKLILDKKIIFKRIGKDRDPAKIQLARISHKDKMDFMIENEIASALEKKQKVLIFLNRKGFATFIYCKNCKDTLKCSRCSSNLRFEYSDKKLVCPSCNQEIIMTDICPKCNSAYVKYGGLGIEKLESNLKRVFPQARILMFDDKVDKNRDYDILLATQKILNFDIEYPDVTVIWNLDNMLNIGDFNSCEDLFRSLAKLLSVTKEKMIISTSLTPGFYLFPGLANIDFEQFYSQELSSRKELKLPPYYHLALVSIRSLNKENSQKVCSRMSSFLEKGQSKQIILAKADAHLRSRIRGKYYKYLLIKSKKIKLLNNMLKKALKIFRSSNVIITVNIDPK